MSQNAQPTERFSRALASIRDWTYPPEVHLQEIPAPTRIAPLSVALEARVPASLRAPGPGAGTGGPAVPAGDSGDLAAGSFILLHDPNPPGVWGGDMRIVTVVKAQLEAELGSDPLLGEVAWTWLAEALDTEMPAPLHLAGTVTRTLSESFGDLRPRGSEVGLEVRASWTPPDAEIGQQLAAWLGFLLRMAGVEPLPSGVTRLTARAPLV